MQLIRNTVRHLCAHAIPGVNARAVANRNFNRTLIGAVPFELTFNRYRSLYFFLAG